MFSSPVTAEAHVAFPRIMYIPSTKRIHSHYRLTLLWFAYPPCWRRY